MHSSVIREKKSIEDLESCSKLFHMITLPLQPYLVIIAHALTIINNPKWEKLPLTMEFSLCVCKNYSQGVNLRRNSSKNDYSLIGFC